MQSFLTYFSFLTDSILRAANNVKSCLYKQADLSLFAILSIY